MKCKQHEITLYQCGDKEVFHGTEGRNCRRGYHNKRTFAAKHRHLHQGSDVVVTYTRAMNNPHSNDNKISRNVRVYFHEANFTFTPRKYGPDELLFLFAIYNLRLPASQFKRVGKAPLNYTRTLIPSHPNRHLAMELPVRW